MDPLLIATGNRHKTGEIAAMLGPAYTVEDLGSHPGYPTVEETGETFLDNAVLKAEGISKVHPGLVLADDSGLEVDALNGEPGVRSARYAGEGASDGENLELLLKRMEGKTQRQARFRCVMVIAREGKVLARFEGKCEGVILEAAQGKGGFGYDPVFVPQGENATFAELPPERKNALSHRGMALAQAIDWLSRQSK